MSVVGAPRAERASFVERTRCIACGGAELQVLSEGAYADEPLHGILASQPWGEHPLPFIEHERWCFVRCAHCGQHFHRRILDASWMQRLYAQWETQESMAQFLEVTSSPRERAERGRHFVVHVLRLQQLLDGCGAEPRLLDFGAGHGEFVAICRGAGFDAHGVDWAADRRRYGVIGMHASLAALRADGAHAAGFDAVTLFEVLEHLADPLGALEELRTLMRPGAVLVLETPDTTGITGLRSFADYLAIAPLGHINGFTPATLCAIAERAGFTPIRPPPVWAATTWREGLRACARNAVARWRKPTTSQYFVLRATKT